MDKNIVTHTGIIKKIENGKVSVSIISKASCISCSLNNVCATGDLKEKIVEVDLKPEMRYNEGEEVTIELKQSDGIWAVLFGYFFPFLVLLSGLIVFVNLGIDQGFSGLLSIALLIPYYSTLYLMRSFFHKKFRSHIS